MSGAEYPGALWVPAHFTNFSRADRPAFTKVVLHCTDGHEHARPVAEMWQEPRHGSSAHFVIGQDGEVIQAISIWRVAYHAHKASAWSVGIEHCARTPGELGGGDPGMPPTEVQLEAGARLVAWLCHLGKLQPTREFVVGHAEADPDTTHSGCPTSAGIDLDDYVARVARSLAVPFA